MDITPKFNHNDIVYQIVVDRAQHFVPCGFCGGEGRIVGVDGSDRQCPKCYGNRGWNEYEENPKWLVRPEQLTVGQVRITVTFKHDADSIFSNYGEQQHEQEEQYMMYETGIKSGTLYYADRLFASVEEAQTECDKRNEAAS